MFSSCFFDPARFPKPRRFNFYNVDFEYLQGFENLAGKCISRLFVILLLQLDLTGFKNLSGLN